MKLRMRVALGSLLLSLLLVNQLHARDNVSHPYRAVAFDYFVIFDANSIVPQVEGILPGRGLEFTKAWRSKQFEYSFLRSITGDHQDFFQVTAEALDYTAEQVHLELDAEKRERLLNAYLTLKPWPDSVAALKKLRAAGIRIIAVSNFSPEMLQRNAEHAGIADLFDQLISTETNRTFKPDPNAYELGLKALSLRKDEIVFAAFGGWDAYGAKHFGYPTVWVNRFALPLEKLGTPPDRTSTGMDGLVEFVMGASHD